MQIFCSKLISQFHSLICIFIIHDSSTPYLKHKGGISLECSSNFFLPVVIKPMLYSQESKVPMSILLPVSTQAREKMEETLPCSKSMHLNFLANFNKSMTLLRKKKKSFKPWLYVCGCLTCSKWKHCISVKNLVKEKHLALLLMTLWIQLIKSTLRIKLLVMWHWCVN